MPKVKNGVHLLYIYKKKDACGSYKIGKVALAGSPVQNFEKRGLLKDLPMKNTQMEGDLKITLEYIGYYNLLKMDVKKWKDGWDYLLKTIKTLQGFLQSKQEEEEVLQSCKNFQNSVFSGHI